MSAPHRPGGLDDLFEAAGEHPRERRTLIALGVVGLALALIMAAFFLGRGLAESTEQASGQAAPPPQGDSGDTRADAAAGGRPRTGDAGSRQQAPNRPGEPSAATAPNGRLTGAPWRGAVAPVAVPGAAATCRAESSMDAGGNRVGYPASHTLDGVASTAWRCAGDGRGVSLTFRLAREQRIAAVGLVPGYAKTDPFSGVDRYAENRRLARVRWSFDGGAWAEQTLSTAGGDRSLQVLRIPPVRSRRVTLTIRDSSPAPRNTVAVSTVRLATPRR